MVQEMVTAEGSAVSARCPCEQCRNSCIGNRGPTARSLPHLLLQEAFKACTAFYGVDMACLQAGWRNTVMASAAGAAPGLAGWEPCS